MQRKINLGVVGCLLIMCLLPSLYKEFLGGEHSLSRIASTILYVLPACFLMAAIKKKWVFACVSTIVFITSFLETMMVILYKNFLIAGNILAIFGTTVDEGTGFIAGTIHALPWTIPCIIFYALALYLHHEQTPVKDNLYATLLFTILSLSFLFYQLRIRWKGNITTTFYVEQNILSRPPYNFWYQTYNAFEQTQTRKEIKLADKMSFGAKRPIHKGKEIYVMAVGESLRYNSLSLGGYERETTPLLESLSNITLFSNYYSTANLTMYSVPQILTRATPDDFAQNYREKSIFKPFQECGFKTFVICAGNLLASKGYEYLSNGCDQSFALTENDDDKIAAIVDSLADKYEKTFFIIQFKGNHGPYNNFHHEQDKYHPNPVTDHVGWDNHEAMVNAYDNTVLFTDDCVYHIIKAIDKQETQSAFMMVSDHGADYDTGVSDHGGNCNPRKAEYHVPLIFWHSDLWGKNHTAKCQNISKNKNRAVNSDNVFYSVCDMADITIDKKYAHPEWSIFNAKLKDHERKLLVPDGKNFIVVK